MNKSLSLYSSTDSKASNMLYSQEDSEEDEDDEPEDQDDDEDSGYLLGFLMMNSQWPRLGLSGSVARH
jgi:hypothetical protein